MERKWMKFLKMVNDPSDKLQFQIRVHIIEARELQPRDRNGMSDPVCFVTAGGKKQHTSVQKKTTICTWDHLMFFELEANPEEFFKGKINVSVMDANTVMRNVEIGSFEFDVEGVYEYDNHEIYRKWVALVDKTGKFDNVQGYLKLSIAVLGPKDQNPNHDEKDDDDDESTGADLESMLLRPPSIPTEQVSLDINVFRAEHLPKMDTFGKIDAYVQAKFGGTPEIATEVMKSNYSPVWCEQLQIPVTTPTLADLIKVKVRDWDQGAKDEDVGAFFLRFSDIGAPKNGIDICQPRWYNVYGTPEGVEPAKVSKLAAVATKMNEGGIEGTAYRGRVLLSVGTRKVSNTKAGKTKIPALDREPPVSKYTLRCDVFEASELQVNGDVSIEVTIGNEKVEGKKAKSENGSASFYQSLDDIVCSLPSDRTQVPDIFINIKKNSLTNKSRIGYIRLKASDLTSNGAPQWAILKPDVFGEVNENQVVGFLQFSVSFGPSETIAMSRSPVTKPQLQKYQLRAAIYQGRDLPAGDENAAADPYAIVRLGKYSKKTRVIDATCFPLWYECLAIDVELPNPLTTAPDISVLIYDKDQITADDFLGRFSIQVSKIGEAMPETPKWYPIFVSDPKVTEGEILASFQLIPLDKAKSIPIPNIVPQFKECILEISAIGCREMLGVNLMPLQNPYIEFDCGGKEKVSTKRSKHPRGSDPNFLEVLELPVQIPLNPIFSPPVNIRVFDDRLIVKPLAGLRSLSLAEFVPWTGQKEAEKATQENLPPPVDSIPGASLIKEEPKDGKTEDTGRRVTSDEIKVDINLANHDEDPDNALLSTDKKDKVKERQNFISNISTEFGDNVKESAIEGVDKEEEKEKEKHPVVKYELERTYKPPFNVYKLYRAKIKHGKTIKVEVGEFKGKFRVLEKSKKSEYEPPVDLVKLYAPVTYVVRAYIIEASQLVPKDINGSNDPFVNITCGKKHIKDKENKKLKTCHPEFFKMYEVKAKFPEESEFKIGIWDWDQVGEDDIIGATSIDLEDRFFSKEWKAYEDKPMEIRTLWNPTSSNPQGQLKLWVDILTEEEASRKPAEPLYPPLPLEYEIRCIVWQTKEVVFKDKKMSDIFVVAYPEGQKPQSTDTHWRSENGLGSFNWRMKFPITIPNPKPRFKIQIWDQDVLNPNDAIAECNLNLKNFLMKAWKKKSSIESLPRQWLAMTHPAFQGVQGRVEVSIDLLSADEARRRPAGLGRSEPDALPKPDRPDTSFGWWRPDKYLQKVFWRAHRWKVIGCAICCCAVIILAIIIYVITIFK